MKQLIIKMLALHPEGLLGSVIESMVSSRLEVDEETIRGVLADMLRCGEIVTKPRVFRPGEQTDNDILFALPSVGVVKLPPNMNPNMKKNKR